MSRIVSAKECIAWRARVERTRVDDTKEIEVGADERGGEGRSQLVEHGPLHVDLPGREIVPARLQLKSVGHTNRVSMSQLRCCYGREGVTHQKGQIMEEGGCGHIDDIVQVGR
jgi:hypothetical protein